MRCAPHAMTGLVETPKHLGLRSEMIFHRAHGVVERHDGYWAIRTPGNPNFFWGNCLVFDRAPRVGEAEKWLRLFDRHIAQVQPRSKHIALGWTEQAMGEREPFLMQGFDGTESVVMAATALSPVPPRRVAAELRPLGPADWPALVDLQVLERGPVHPEPEFRAFIQGSVVVWQLLAKRGAGGWWGAFAGSQLVAALGLYWDT